MPLLLLACFFLAFGMMQFPLTETWGQFGYEPQVKQENTNYSLAGNAKAQTLCVYIKVQNTTDIFFPENYYMLKSEILGSSEGSFSTSMLIRRYPYFQPKTGWD